jgi:ribosomal-protein-alanine N-acetyltransferase
VMEIRTERLLLRRARESDLHALHAVFTHPEAMRYWSRPPHEHLEQTREWLRSMLDSPPPPASDDFVIEHAGTVIGKAGSYRLPEIGYILHPDHWRRGLAFEALDAFIRHAFATHDVPRLTADVDPRNVASIRLLTKLGFHETHRAERTWNVGGQWTDSAYFALDRP